MIPKGNWSSATLDEQIFEVGDILREPPLSTKSLKLTFRLILQSLKEEFPGLEIKKVEEPKEDSGKFTVVYGLIVFGVSAAVVGVAAMSVIFAKAHRRRNATAHMVNEICFTSDSDAAKFPFYSHTFR